MSYISGQPDVLSSFFVLLAILFFANKKCFFRKFSLYVAVCSFLFLLALLVKESAIVFPFLAFLIVLYGWGGLKLSERKQYVYSLLIFSFVSLVYLFFRFVVLDLSATFGLVVGNPEYTGSLLVRLTTSLHYFFEYIRLLFFPLNLNFEKEMVHYVHLTFQAVVSGCLVLCLFFFMYRSFFRKKIVFFGLAWFFIGLIPVSGLIPINAPYMEHWLYLPLFGFLFLCLSLGRTLFLILSRFWRVLSSSFLICVLLLFSFRVYVRNLDWSDPIRFYTSEIEYSPNSWKLHNNLAVQLIENARYDEALEHYLISANLFPSDISYYNLGNYYATFGQYDLAFEAYNSSLSLNHNFIYAYQRILDLFRLHPDIEKSSLELISSYISMLQEGGSISAIEIERLQEIWYSLGEGVVIQEKRVLKKK